MYGKIWEFLGMEIKDMPQINATNPLFYFIHQGCVQPDVHTALSKSCSSVSFYS